MFGRDPVRMIEPRIPFSVGHLAEGGVEGRLGAPIVRHAGLV
jgi:hypothetical protein